MNVAGNSERLLAALRQTADRICAMSSEELQELFDVAEREDVFAQAVEDLNIKEFIEYGDDEGPDCIDPDREWFESVCSVESGSVQVVHAANDNAEYGVADLDDWIGLCA